MPWREFRLRRESQSVPSINFRRPIIVVEDKPKDVASEELALKQAIATANEQISEIYEQVTKQSGKGEAAIFRAHLALLNDAEIFLEVCASDRGRPQRGMVLAASH